MGEAWISAVVFPVLEAVVLLEEAFAGYWGRLASSSERCPALLLGLEPLGLGLELLLLLADAPLSSAEGSSAR